MSQLLQGELEKLNRLRWSPWMKKEILDASQYFSEQTLDKQIKSWSMGSRLVNVGQNPSGKDDLNHERSGMDGIGEN